LRREGSQVLRFARKKWQAGFFPAVIKKGLESKVYPDRLLQEGATKVDGMSAAGGNSFKFR
jgi:hypothetical protein